MTITEHLKVKTAVSASEKSNVKASEPTTMKCDEHCDKGMMANKHRMMTDWHNNCMGACKAKEDWDGMIHHAKKSKMHSDRARSYEGGSYN